MIYPTNHFCNLTKRAHIKFPFKPKIKWGKNENFSKYFRICKYQSAIKYLIRILRNNFEPFKSNQSNFHKLNGYLATFIQMTFLVTVVKLLLLFSLFPNFFWGQFWASPISLASNYFVSSIVCLFAKLQKLTAFLSHFFTKNINWMMTQLSKYFVISLNH